MTDREATNLTSYLSTMKTLKKTIEEVMNTSSSLSTKRNNLKKIGCLNNTDIALIINAYVKDHPESKVKAESFAYTFGVEIETYNVERSRMYDSARTYGVNIEYQGYNHRDSLTVYKFVTDASISGENGIECVTPVLKGEKTGFDSLERCCTALNAAGAKVNKSTGLHVHIGCAAMTGEWYANVFKNYQKLEKAIDSFMAESRRGTNCRWAQSLQSCHLDNCHDFEDVHDRLNGNRYHKVNPCSWSRHKTIEFRQHQGSTDFKKIQNWVKFCAKLVGWSKKNVLDHSITSVSEIPFLTDAEKRFFTERAAQLAA